MSKLVSWAGHHPEFHKVEGALRGRKWCQNSELKLIYNILNQL